MKRFFSKAPFHSSGFTLIEVVVVITILSIIGIGFFAAHIRSVEVFVDTIEEEKLSSESWVALHRIRKELRHAFSLKAPLPGSTGGVLDFIRPSGSFDSCVSCQDRSTSIRYRFDQNNSTLIRETTLGAHIIADNVTSFVADAISTAPGNILVTFTLTRTAKPQDASSRRYVMTSAVTLNGAINDTWREVLP